MGETFPRNEHDSLRCLYTNVHSTGKKHEELEVCVQFQGVVEAWWVVHTPGVLQRMNADSLERTGWQGEEATFYVKEQGKCTELCLGLDDEPAENF